MKALQWEHNAKQERVANEGANLNFQRKGQSDVFGNSRNGQHFSRNFPPTKKRRFVGGNDFAANSVLAEEQLRRRKKEEEEGLMPKVRLRGAPLEGL